MSKMRHAFHFQRHIDCSVVIPKLQYWIGKMETCPQQENIACQKSRSYITTTQLCRSSLSVAFLSRGISIILWYMCSSTNLKFLIVSIDIYKHQNCDIGPIKWEPVHSMENNIHQMKTMDTLPPIGQSS
jgi:hypothetical protein